MNHGLGQLQGQAHCDGDVRPPLVSEGLSRLLLQAGAIYPTPAFCVE